MSLGVSVRVAAVAVMAGAVVSPVWACSICRCGDATFNALGVDGIAVSGLRAAVDWDELEKSQGDLSSGESSSVVERRSSLLLAWGLSERFSVFAHVPYASRELVEMEDEVRESVAAEGWADPELSAQARLWASALEGDVGSRINVFGTFGVKTDWGVNEAARDGERLDEHAQPGTGAVDVFGGLSVAYLVDPRSAVFVSAQYRHTGQNEFGYEYGDVSLANLAYERKLGARFDAVVELNYRSAERDQVDDTGALDPDTGGSAIYLTPRLLFDVGGGWVLRGAVQVPVSEAGLNGGQDEDAVWNVGVTWAKS